MIAGFSALGMVILSAAMLLTFGRLVLGPRLPDRAVALDLLATIFICAIAVYAIYTDNDLFLDIALVAALLNFLGTVAFGFFLERYR